MSQRRLISFNVEQHTHTVPGTLRAFSSSLRAVALWSFDLGVSSSPCSLSTRRPFLAHRLARRTFTGHSSHFRSFDFGVSSCSLSTRKIGNGDSRVNQGGLILRITHSPGARRSVAFLASAGCSSVSVRKQATAHAVITNPGFCVYATPAGGRRRAALRVFFAAHATANRPEPTISGECPSRSCV